MLSLTLLCVCVRLYTVYDDVVMVRRVHYLPFVVLLLLVVVVMIVMRTERGLLNIKHLELR
jgi:hypothetical protein